MSKLTKTREWLKEATGLPKTKKEAQWFLCYDYVGMFCDLTRKDLARELQGFIKDKPTYKALEECFFENMEEAIADGVFTKEECVQRVREFYGLK